MPWNASTASSSPPPEFDVYLMFDSQEESDCKQAYALRAELSALGVRACCAEPDQQRPTESC